MQEYAEPVKQQPMNRVSTKGMYKTIILMCLSVLLYTFKGYPLLLSIVVELVASAAGCFFIIFLQHKGRIIPQRLSIGIIFLPLAVYLVKALVSGIVVFSNLPLGEVAVAGSSAATIMYELLGLGCVWPWVFTVLLLVRQSDPKRSMKRPMLIVVAAMVVIAILNIVFSREIAVMFGSDQGMIAFSVRNFVMLTIYMTVVWLIAFGAVFLISWIIEKNRAAE